jgi:hypothetical protein
MARHSAVDRQFPDQCTAPRRQFEEGMSVAATLSTAVALALWFIMAASAVAAISRARVAKGSFLFGWDADMASHFCVPRMFDSLEVKVLFTT